MFDFGKKKEITGKPTVNKTALEQEIILLKNHIKRIEPYERAYKLADAKIQIQEKEIQKLKFILEKARKTLKFYYDKYGSPAEENVEVTKEVTDYLDFLIQSELDDRPNTKT